jgi:hypothetical protein
MRGDIHCSVNRSTILIRNLTRDRLKKAGRKDQTYDDLINELIDNLGQRSLRAMTSQSLASPSQSVATVEST